MSELSVSGENESECDDNSLQIEIKDKNGVMIDSPVMRFSEGSIDLHFPMKLRIQVIMQKLFPIQRWQMTVR